MKKKIVNYIRDLFVYFGIYYLVSLIWTDIEIIVTGSYSVKTRDTIIALLISAVLYTILRVFCDNTNNIIFVIPDNFKESAYWISHDENAYTSCSNCGKISSKSAYCPNCGCKMKEEEDKHE